MRVVAGSAKGRLLVAPKGYQARPTLQRVKESVFNILAGRICDAVVLDLFAGAGSLGIEALSRGASRCVFVDSDRRCTRAIERNLQTTELSDRARVHTMDVYRAVDMLGGFGSRFDLIFADPPYEKGHELALLLRLSEGRLLSPRGTVVLEHSRRTETPAEIGRLVRDSVRTYGDTYVSLYSIGSEGRQ
jgi:16S rRNA (guanine(966)-N(2))-methyltransferase RsmD